MYTVEELRQFEKDVSNQYDKGNIRGPVHLSYGNEDYLIKFFEENVKSTDWVFSTWRNHYHALLHGVPKEKLWDEIMAGRSISFQSSENHFYTSAIVNGILPIAVGTALGIKWKNLQTKVWCFVGDMSAESGPFYEAVKYSIRNELPIHFIIEDNGLSTNTPTQESWGTKYNMDYWHIFNHPTYHDAFNDYITMFKYKREKYPHVGIGKWIHF